MNILIIGNGFDLAHGLPTKYKDFLYFINLLQRNHRKEVMSADLAIGCFKRLLQEKRMWEVSMDGIFNEEAVLKYVEDMNRFTDVKNGNFWMQDFIYRQTEMGGRWVDFEQEISDCVKILENTSNGSNVDFYNTLLETRKYILTMEKSDVIKKLEKDLENLKKTLELYIFMVNKLPVEEKESFKRFGEMDHVISFNYTDTYKKYWDVTDGDSAFVDFVHGKAGAGNVILGAGETLGGDDISTELACVKFKKYFQRIHNRTGGMYRKWIDKAEQMNNYNKQIMPTHNIKIYGHSLDMTDKDILNYVITSKTVRQVEIFYYENEETSDYENQIINLIQVIGKEELIARVGDGKIVFKSTNELS